LHAVHHRYPRASWIQLPKLLQPGEFQISFWKVYLRMWRGVTAAHEPRPFLDKTAVERAASAHLRTTTLEALSDNNFHQIDQIQRKHGVDFANVLLGMAFEQRWRTLEAGLTTESPTVDSVRVILLPGAFHKEFPRFGSGGGHVLDLCKQLGVPADRVPLLSLGRVSENVELIRKHFEENTHPGEKWIIVSISKSGTEFRTFFETYPNLVHNVAGWINIAGLVKGSPIADMMRESFWRSRILRAFLRAKGGSEGVMKLPLDLTVVNVVGFPYGKVSRSLRNRYVYLSQFGTNDAGVLHKDSIVEPGVVLPILGADHYCGSVHNAQNVLRKALQWTLAHSHGGVVAKSS
jgi:hypothetical protein